MRIRLLRRMRRPKCTSSRRIEPDSPAAACLLQPKRQLPAQVTAQPVKPRTALQGFIQVKAVATEEVESRLRRCGMSWIGAKNLPGYHFSNRSAGSPIPRVPEQRETLLLRRPHRLFERRTGWRHVETCGSRPAIPVRPQGGKHTGSPARKTLRRRPPSRFRPIGRTARGEGGARATARSGPCCRQVRSRDRSGNRPDCLQERPGGRDVKSVGTGTSHKSG